DELTPDGYLDRRHGSGTYVTEPKSSQPLPLNSFSEDMRRRSMVPGGRTLALPTTSAGPLPARPLQVSPAQRPVRVKRLRLVADLTPQRSRNGRTAGVQRGHQGSPRTQGAASEFVGLNDRGGDGATRRLQPGRASATFKP